MNLVTTFLVTVEHEKPIPDLIDLVAARAYTIQGVTNTAAVAISPRDIEQQRLAAC